MTARQQNVLIVGLGEVAATHLRVLEHITGADVVAGVDIVPRPGLAFRGAPLPVYPDLRQAADLRQIDVVVIATPTPSHAPVCADIAALLPAARILIEKPAADNLAGARHVLQDIARQQPVDVAYHMAFAPEVLWAEQTWQSSRSLLGVPVSAEISFTDPYDEEFEPAAARLGNSWIDSGINALSVLRRFTGLTSRISLRRIGQRSHSVFEAHMACQSDGHEFDALILTSWHVTDPAKTTRIRYSSGAQLVMDHTAVAAYLILDGSISDVFAAGAAIHRRERHYRALYESWLTGNQPIATPQDHLLLHELLLEPTEGLDF